MDCNYCIVQAMDPNNSPSWNILDQSTITRSRLPLFVKNVLTYQGPPDIQVSNKTDDLCGEISSNETSPPPLPEAKLVI